MDPTQHKWLSLFIIPFLLMGRVAPASSVADMVALRVQPMLANVTFTKFTTGATSNGTEVANGFKGYAHILSPAGKNRTFGYGSRVNGAVGGFVPEFLPGVAITKVELRLDLYTSKVLKSRELVKVTPYVGGTAGETVTIQSAAVNDFIVTTGVGTLNLDLTHLRTWKWADLKTLQLLMDQTHWRP